MSKPTDQHGTEAVGGNRAAAGGFITFHEVYLEHGIPVATQRSWRARGRGPESYLKGGKLGYDRSELERHFEAEREATKRGGAA